MHHIDGSPVVEQIIAVSIYTTKVHTHGRQRHGFPFIILVSRNKEQAKTKVWETTPEKFGQRCRQEGPIPNMSQYSKTNATEEERTM